MAELDEKADRPPTTPEFVGLGNGQESGVSPASEIGLSAGEGSCATTDDGNMSNAKMLKAEKVLGLSSAQVKRSSSMPVIVKEAPKSGSDPHKQRRDECIMDTNKSSIVSKRSVEKLYYHGQPEYFRYFVSKLKRRSPLINRGYWLRMKAIEHTVSCFLSEQTAKRKFVINLGCGYDPLPFSFLGKSAVQCHGATFVDVDYPVLMRNKVGIIDKTEQLRALLPKLMTTANERGVLASSDPYVAIGCDLINLSQLDETLQEHLQLRKDDVAIMFVSEVSTAYMDQAGSQAVFEWVATYADVRFCLLEQHLPDGAHHPFAVTMLAHFEKLRTPLRTVGTMEQMRARFLEAGFPDSGTEIRSLWELWSDPTFLGAEERRALDRIEPFDEWEEFALFGSHYFLLIAEKGPSKATRTSVSRSSWGGTPPETPPRGTDADVRTPQRSSEAGEALHTIELQEPHDFRRFAAVMPPSELEEAEECVGLHGGVGTQERLDSCSIYATRDAPQPIIPPALRQGIVCHAITRLGTTLDCLMTGGRTSPDKASAQAWLRTQGRWRRVQDLPCGRYRHCAVPLVLPTQPRQAHTVLLYGGKASDGQILDEWLMWTGETGWQRVPVVGDAPAARFGACMITDSRDATAGILGGGMTSAGRVLHDLWHWTLEADMTLRCRNVTARASSCLDGVGSGGDEACILGRFGAQLARSSRGILLVGGIAGGRMLPRALEIVNMRTLRAQPLRGPRPLFVGHALHEVAGGLLVLGGGATCFSFGTTWNRACLLADPSSSEHVPWRLHAVAGAGPAHAIPDADYLDASPPPNADTAGADAANGASPSSSAPVSVRISETVMSPEFDFKKCVAAGRPIVLSQCDLGACTSAWTDEYLKAAVGAERPIAVHASPASTQMDFAQRNFDYRTQPFGAFLDAAARGERVYLRALSRDAPSARPTSLADDFPGLVDDFRLPPQLAAVVEAEGAAHSSPLRIAGPVRMWLHYDVMANVLCQVRGRRRLLLFPPSDVSRLSFAPAASSSSLDVFDAPLPASTHPHEALLAPGDVLFIPPLWLHAAEANESGPSSASVAVNVFFRSLPAQGYAPGRDVYGNRDLAAYERGRRDVARVVRSFDGLPADVAAFYLARLASELAEQARRVRSEVDREGGQREHGRALHEVYAELG